MFSPARGGMLLRVFCWERMGEFHKILPKELTNARNPDIVTFRRIANNTLGGDRMNGLTIAQAYALCAIDKEGKNVTYPNTVHSGCIVMGAFLEMFLAGNIDLDGQGHVQLKRAPQEDAPVYRADVWRALHAQKPQTLKQWMEHYLNGFSVKMIRRIVNGVIHTLLETGGLVREKKQGLFRERVHYRANARAVERVVEDLRFALLEDGGMDNEEIALAILLREGGLLGKYVSREEEKAMRARLRRVEHTDVGEKAVIVKQVLDELDAFMVAVLFS